MKAFGQALHIEGKEAKEEADSQIESMSESIAAGILGRKKMAMIETIVQTAEGIGSLAVQDYRVLHYTS